jgi:histidine triad (HIT) family protein
MSVMKECLFCQIAARDVPAYVVHEDSRLLAFLDLHPIRQGHTQIIPKDHFPFFDDAPTEIITSITLLGQKLALAMKRLYRVQRVAFVFTGGDIAHLHAHVIPMHEKTDITSRLYIAEETVTFRQTPRVSDRELAQTAADLSKGLQGVLSSIAINFILPR